LIFLFLSFLFLFLFLPRESPRTADRHS